MKFSILSGLPLLAALASAAPTPTLNEVVDRAIAKRATITDIADTGYATQNGGCVEI